MSIAARPLCIHSAFLTCTIVGTIFCISIFNDFLRFYITLCSFLRVITLQISQISLSLPAFWLRLIRSAFLALSHGLYTWPCMRLSRFGCKNLYVWRVYTLPSVKGQLKIRRVIYVVTLPCPLHLPLPLHADCAPWDWIPLRRPVNYKTIIYIYIYIYNMLACRCNAGPMHGAHETWQMLP